MIALFIIMCLVGLWAGYQLAALGDSLLIQRTMNSIRKDVGLEPQKYKVKTNPYSGGMN